MQAQSRSVAGQGGQRPKGNGSLRRAVGYLGRQRRYAFYAYGALLIATAAQLLMPQFVQRMIDAVTNGWTANIQLNNPATRAAATLTGKLDQLKLDAANAETLLATATLLILGMALVRGVFAFVQAYMAEKTSQGIAFDLRNEIFATIERLSFSYHDRNQTGQLMIRATDDVEKVRLFIAQGLVTAAQGIILLVCTLILELAANWRLTLVVLPTLPIALAIFIAFGIIVEPLFTRIQQQLSTLNTVLQESLAGIKVVKAFAREDYEQKRFDNAADNLLSALIRNSQILSFMFPLVFLVAQIGQPLILYFGGQQILAGSLTYGEYQKFSLYLAFLFFPLFQLGFIIPLMGQAAASSVRIFDILDTKNDIADKPGAIDMPPIKGHVEFKNVTFRYFGSGEPVLHHVSFEAQPGQTIALLGATGSGKTTIINLIPRFYDVSSNVALDGVGAVLIDGIDVRDVKLDSLRSQIGIVLQETNLFSGTIRDNIAFGRPDATMEEVIAAAKAASAHDFIKSFPQGYDTPVGERGTTLSGGQKQRIAIARALVLDPHLLILDDSTSSVDLVTEYHIQKALDNLMKGRTSFVIAQRISTVLNADQILVLDKGEIVARGKHEELMESSPIYAEIYHSQLIGDAAVDEAASATQEA